MVTDGTHLEVSPGTPEHRRGHGAMHDGILGPEAEGVLENGPAEAVRQTGGRHGWAGSSS